MRRCLVVANQTLANPQLAEALRARHQAGECAFHVVVPATPPTSRATWTEGHAHRLAEQRLDEVLGRLHGEGLAVTGEIGDANPLQAVGDVLRREPFDEIVVSTLPPGLSRWLHLDLPHRLEKSSGLPVAHVVARLQPAT